MDPALRQLIRQGDGDDELEAIARLADGHMLLPHGTREIARFSDIRTMRLNRRDIVRVWSDPRIASLKAPRLLQIERPLLGRSPSVPVLNDRRPRGVRETGRGVVVGVVDWGFDFAHPAFRDARGASRIRAIWDQRPPRPDRPPGPPGAPQPYDYGRLLSHGMIENALAAPRPYESLGYHPADSDGGMGAHGTHVGDIAAGTRRAAGGGMAPGADLVFVHLAASPLSGLADLGDSVRILEAVEFISRVAGDRPLVINMSIGRHGGPHSGLTLVERALDNFVSERSDTQVVQSAGNYGIARAHAAGALVPGRRRTLRWWIGPGDPTANEMEIWYSNRDRFGVAVRPRGQAEAIVVPLGESRTLRTAEGKEIGRVYHRAFDPNTPDHHVDIFLNPGAPWGEWQVELSGEVVTDGRFSAWIERDRAGRRGQSVFLGRDVESSGSVGSICNGFRTIAVGAADTSTPFMRPARFASAGPTRDGRTKPNLVAPGVGIYAARSAGRGAVAPSDRLTRMSGASQASPYTAGVVALCLEAGRGGLTDNDLRQAVVGTAHPVAGPADLQLRVGAGLVDPVAAVGAARAIGRAAKARKGEQEHVAR